MSDECFENANVRILNSEDTREFVKRNLTNFPKYDDLQGLKVGLFSILSSEIKVNGVHELEVGWIARKNKKHVLKSDLDVKEAYQYYKENTIPVTFFVGKMKKKPNSKRNVFGKLLAKYMLVLWLHINYFTLIFNNIVKKAAMTTNQAMTTVGLQHRRNAGGIHRLEFLKYSSVY